MGRPHFFASAIRMHLQPKGSTQRRCTGNTPYASPRAPFRWARRYFRFALAMPTPVHARVQCD